MQQPQLQLNRGPNLQPRRFVYRAAEPDAALPHPHRRSTDSVSTQCALFDTHDGHATLLQFRVHISMR